jgi:biotin carboxylase
MSVVVPPDRPSLLVVRTGSRKFREYLLRSIAPRYRVHMILGVEPSWECQYLSGWTVQVDTLDTSAMVAAARKIDAVTPIDGVVCWDESRIPQAAAIAADLGLPGGDPAAIARCRDKHRTRTALAAAGVPQPASYRVDTVDEALAVAGRLGYPVVLKPSDLALSLGVVVVTGPDHLRAHFGYTASTRALELPDYQPRVLVEEYVDGAEISVDVAVHRGRTFPLCVARKVIGYPPYCVEVGHYVDGDDPLLDDEGLRRVLDDTHRAVGFTDGVTHTELKLSPTGPKVIEVNGRLGGDLIPYLGLRATGVDVGLAAAAVACGRPPAVTRTRRAAAGVRFFYPRHDDTRIEAIGFDASALPAAMDTVAVLAAPGSVASPPPDGIRNGRVALATAVAGTVADCAAALDAAEAALRINGE